MGDVAMMLIALYATVISILSNLLGLATPVFNTPATPTNPGNPNLLSAVGVLIGFVINIAYTFFQLLTFQVDVPVYVSLLLMTPIYVFVFIRGARMIRGN